MSIKLRLRLTYIAMLIIPFILIVIVSNIFMSFVVGETEFSSGAKIQRNNYHLLTQIISSNNKLLKNINKQALQDSDKFLDQEYLLQLEKSSTMPYTGIVLRSNNKIVYASDYIKKDLSDALLPSFSSERLDETSKDLYVLGQQDFYFSDGSEGSIFYILKTEGLKLAFRENSII